MKGRLNFIYLLFLLLFGVIILRLYFWQVLSFDQLEGIGIDQRFASIKLPARRGNIYTQDGSPIVVNQKAYGVFLKNDLLKDRMKNIKILGDILSINEASLSSRLNSGSSTWITLMHKADEEQVKKLKESGIEGLSYFDEAKRFYPESSMSAHLLGFTGKDAKGDDKGYFGVEGYYNEQLKGREGLIKQETDANGNPILTGKSTTISADDGRDLYLYLDKTIQYVAEKNLKLGIEKYKAKGGNIIVMDPVTGGILAMASFPSYDPGNYMEYPTIYYKNPAVSTFYEPGSTFKTLVMAAAINEKAVTSDTEYDEKGPIEIGGYTINTWNQKYNGKINLTQVLEKSSNVGMVFVGEKLGDDKLLRYIENFGFGKLTGIDLQDEASPILREKSKWYAIDYATASFGQGIAVTPLQMIRAVSAIANGGNLIEPHIIRKIKLDSGEFLEIMPKIIRKVIKPETARVVAEMMVSAIDNGETKRLKPIGYRIAGKTGTAQIPISGHYDANKTIASFVGFAPVDDPKFIILVTINEPTTSPWGSETAAPVFFNVAKEIFSYLKISPN